MQALLFGAVVKLLRQDNRRTGALKAADAANGSPHGRNTSNFHRWR
jgi:hypothetical protein